MIKRMLLMLAAMTVIVGGTIGYKLFGRHMMNLALAAQKPPPVVVATAEARMLEWRPTLHAVGSFTATQGIVVSAQLDGAVTQIAFEPGTLVASGQLLVQQDISTETAQLDGAEAAATLASLALERAKQLRADGSNSPSDFDAATANFQQARAAVAAVRSTIEKKTIRAPFAGRAGIRLVNLGQFLRSGATVISLQALDPIFFDFTLPQQDAPQIACGRQVSIAVDAFPGVVFRGGITAANANLDTATRAVQLQATLENRGGRLQPGMFGSIEIELPVAENVVTLPLAAIVYNPYGNAVYVVEPGEGGALIVRQQFVQTGATRGDQVAILRGVKAGAVIVTAGQLKLRNGASILVNNSIVPADSAAPKPDHP